MKWTIVRITLTLICASMCIFIAIIQQGCDSSEPETDKEVTGVFDFSAAIHIAPGESWVDESGNTNIKGRVAEVALSLTIDDRTIECRDRIMYNGVEDARGNGTFQATQKTFFIGEAGDEPNDDNIIFQGSGEFTREEGRTTSGHYELRGYGEFAGTELIITKFVQRGTTNIYDLEGILHE